MKNKKFIIVIGVFLLMILLSIIILVKSNNIEKTKDDIDDLSETNIVEDELETENIVDNTIQEKWRKTTLKQVRKL
jgi:uncharacterized membrane protein